MRDDGTENYVRLFGLACKLWSEAKPDSPLWPSWSRKCTKTLLLASRQHTKRLPRVPLRSCTLPIGPCLRNLLLSSVFCLRRCLRRVGRAMTGFTSSINARRWSLSVGKSTTRARVSAAVLFLVQCAHVLLGVVLLASLMRIQPRAWLRVYLPVFFFFLRARALRMLCCCLLRHGKQ